MLGGFVGDPMGSGLNQAALMHSKTCKDESEYFQANGVGKNISIEYEGRKFATLRMLVSVDKTTEKYYISRLTW